jgi:hypothetical protein
MDNPAVVGPAGRVHSTIQDWALFVGDQLRGLCGQAGVLSTEGYQALATPPFGGDYALGWLVVDRPWAEGMALAHSGSNEMNFATAWMAPAKDFAILVCTDLGDAAVPVDQVVAAASTTLVPTLAP